jgi:undecaprenyl-diphosphatase
MQILEALILGIVQGITEWLPVSSSGHLVIFQELFKIQASVFFDILLHLGTLLVILLVFWRDILKLLKALFTLNFKSKYGRLVLFILIGSIPTGLIGYFFHDLFTGFFSNLLVVGIALILTGILLFFSKRKLGNKELNYKNSFLIGVMQGIAIIPGISRSGATIGFGLLKGIDRKEVVRFSFLLFIPAVIGAAIFEGSKVGVSEGFLVSLVGVLSAVVVGYFSLKILIKLIYRNKFHNFAYYCWVLGLLMIIWSLI